MTDNDMVFLNCVVGQLSALSTNWQCHWPMLARLNDFVQMRGNGKGAEKAKISIIEERQGRQEKQALLREALIEAYSQYQEIKKSYHHWSKLRLGLDRSRMVSILF